MSGADNGAGTPGGVPGLNLDKEICANVTPNKAGDSRFAPYYLTYGNNFNKASSLTYTTLCSESGPTSSASTCVLLLPSSADARELLLVQHRAEPQPGSFCAEVTALTLQGDDSLFKSKFCLAYQAMSTIGYQFPVDYADVAKYFVLS